jgi:sulfate permease, SulP family
VPLILAIAFSVVLLGGVLEALFGFVRLGTLIKFAPQPVMAGFQNAAALLLFLVQLGNVCGFDHSVPFTQISAHLAEIKPLSVIIAAITFTAMWNAKKILPKVPPMLVGIVLGCALGARSPLAVLVNAAALLAASALLFRWLGEIPRVALSAVIMVIAVQHFDLWSLRLLGRLRNAPRSLRTSTAFDALVVIVVAVLSIALNIVAAVFIGLAIAVVLFLLHMSRSVVRRSYRCDDVHSRKSRTAPERQFLENAGHAILVMELQGALFFGTGETMTKTVESSLGQGTSCVILDLRRLTEIDSTGANTLLEQKADLTRRNISLLLAAGSQTRAIQRLEEFGALATFGDLDTFTDVDRAIEHAEDHFLEAGEQIGGAELTLNDVAFFAGFTPAHVSVITAFMKRKEYRQDAVLFREGDVGDEVLIVTSGTASAYLHLTNGANIRLATFAPGTVFGELAILDQGPRAATVIADGKLVCYGMTRADYGALAEKSPAAAIQFMAAIGRELSGRLRTANRTIHQLEA